MLSSRDPFVKLARYYDKIMAHVDYGRWAEIASAMADLLPPGFMHMDAACGTGTLVKMLADQGWSSFGLDRSFSMLKAGRLSDSKSRSVAADLRALPLAGSVHYITCLFDSINFLLEPGDLRVCLTEISRALTGNGVVYLDAVTERMVTEHFVGQDVSETDGRFSSTWETTYCPRSKVAQIVIRLNDGPAAVLRERVYDQTELETAIRDAELSLLGVFDSEQWGDPNEHTARLDFVAAKDPSTQLKRTFKRVVEKVRAHFS